MLPFLVKEITRLSQEEGLTDKEIADVIGCSRATINRTRIKYNIPTANLQERNDKEYQCVFCKKVVLIKRKERKKRYCDECRDDLKISKPNT